MRRDKVSTGELDECEGAMWLVEKKLFANNK